MRRMWRVKKPWFCVEKEGKPFAPLERLEESQLLDRVELLGLLRPLLMLRPGLAQPPPGTGDGDRERDIGSEGVPAGRGRNIVSMQDDKSKIDCAT